MFSDKFKYYHQQVLQTLQVLEYPTQPDALYEPIRYILDLGGKRVRPILTLMAADIYTDIAKALKPAIAVEVFHNFTLLHDDIMDDAPIRRGKSTVHEKWNANTAILSGDAMMIKAYELIANTSGDILPQVLKSFNKTALEVCEGQQFDMDFETLEDVSISEYLNMIKLKTAVLLGFALELGARIGNASDADIKNLYDFGINIGLAFQIQDDILDVFADKNKFGKQVGGDIISNKKTFLLLKAKELATGNTQAELNNWLAKTDFDKTEKVVAITAIYDNLKVRKLAEELQEEYYQKALKNLFQIKVQESKKEELLFLAKALMQREV